MFDKLTALADKLRSNKDYGDEPMKDLRNLLLEQEITSFQFNQSGIPDALVTYLCSISDMRQQREYFNFRINAYIFNIIIR